MGSLQRYDEIRLLAARTDPVLTGLIEAGGDEQIAACQLAGCVRLERGLAGDWSEYVDRLRLDGAAYARGTAFGIYNAVAGIGALVSSVVFGVIWNVYGAPVAFASGAALAVIAAVLLFVLVPAPADNSTI